MAGFYLRDVIEDKTYAGITPSYREGERGCYSEENGWNLTEGSSAAQKRRGAAVFIIVTR